MYKGIIPTLIALNKAYADQYYFNQEEFTIELVIKKN